MHNIRTGMRSRPLVILAAAVLVFIFPPAAAAHGVLQSSAPAAGTVLPSAPDRLELQYNESVDPQLSTVILVWKGGRTPLALRATDGPRLSYILPPLEPGLYVVDWRVISAADGHLTRGAFTFGVGVSTLPVAAAGTIGPTWLEVAARWVGLIGVFVLVGGAVMMLVLPAPEAAVPGLRGRLRRLAVAATAALAVSGLVRAFNDAAAIAGGIFPLGAFGSSLFRVVAASHSGHDLIFRITGAVFVAQLLRPALPLEREGIGAVLGVMLIGPTLTMHGLAVGLVGVLMGMAHLVAASVWIGGLAFFGSVYLPLVRTVAPEAVRPAAVRFSRVAVIAVAVLVLTGFVQGRLYVGSPAALTDSPYGRTLLAKLVVAAALLVVAAVNRWGVLPRLATAAEGRHLLLTLVRLETALGLVVALLAATIAISPPAKIAVLGRWKPSLQRSEYDVLHHLIEVARQHPLQVIGEFGGHRSQRPVAVLSKRHYRLAVPPDELPVWIDRIGITRGEVVR